MPSGTWVFGDRFLNWLAKYRPRSILDVGCGTGRFGFIAREYLDLAHGRLDKTSWLYRIDAVEVWEPYVTPLHRLIYDLVMVGDFRDAGFRAQVFSTRYAVTLLFDILEHMERREAERVLDETRHHSEWTLVTTPNGFRQQGEVLENPYEVHRCGWLREELERVGAQRVEEVQNNLWAVFFGWV